MSKAFFITTPLYYVNAQPHIGHSYTQIACDVVARFYRLKGQSVYFMTGTDEHGEKIEKASRKAGLKAGEEKKFVDGILEDFKMLWRRLGIEYDFFIRTSDKFHEEAVRHVISKINDNGDIYMKRYNGYFCTPCEMFWSDFQAEVGLCPDCKRPLEKIEEDNYFFRISKYQQWLINYIESEEAFVKPESRRNEVQSILRSGDLIDLCISRPKNRLRWGIEFPFDKNYVVYVWFDALINYISGAGYPADPEKFRSLWPADYHIIGKDIIRHHAIYWPIMLKALGLAMPKTIFAHGWWVIKGEKMSKSKGNIVDPNYIIDNYGIDTLRYFLLRDKPFGLDGSFSEEAVIKRHDSDLANDLGNLLNRTLTMVEKYYGGMLPAADNAEAPASGGPSASPRGELLRDMASALPGKIDAAMAELDSSLALSDIWVLVNTANKYIEEARPWLLHKKKDHAGLKRVICDLLESLRAVIISISPFLPSTASAMWEQAGFSADLRAMRFSDISRWGTIKGGTAVKKAGPIFPRIKSM